MHKLNDLKRMPYDAKYSYKLYSTMSRDVYPLMLDIGCGDGEKTVLFKPLTSDTIGLDLSVEKVRKAKERGIEVIVGDAKHLPFKAEAFGAATLFHVVEHIDDAGKVLDEVLRVLQKGGFSLLITPNRRRLTSIVSGIKKILNPKVKYPLNPDHVFEYSKEDLRALFAKTKFERHRIYPLVLGMITSKYTFGLKNPPKILSNFCSQWLVYVEKNNNDHENVLHMGA